MGKVERGGVSRKEFWRGKIGEQRGSGLGVREFCGREGLSANSFYGWRRALAVVSEVGPEGGAGGELRPGVGEGVFAPVIVPGPGRGGTSAEALAERDGGVEVLSPGGLVVRVRPGFDAATLTRLVAALADGRC